MLTSNSSLVLMGPGATPTAPFQVFHCSNQATCPTQIRTTFCVCCTTVDATLQQFKCQSSKLEWKNNTTGLHNILSLMLIPMTLTCSCLMSFDLGDRLQMVLDISALSATCECILQEQTPDHVVFRCLLYCALVVHIWPAEARQQDH